MGIRGRTIDSEIDRIATLAHGVVTRTQLLEAGISRKQIARRVRAGSLIRAHPGVYRVGHRAQSTEAAYMAAVLAAGEGSTLSGLAAAYLHELVRGPPPISEVTSRTERRIAGVRTRRCRSLSAQDVTRVRGIAVTTVPRTLVDIAAELSPDALARACHEAGVRYRTTPAQVEAVLALRPRRAGARKLRRVIKGDVRVALSRLESLFLRLLSDAGLPLPLTNRPAGGRRVDCRWPECRLTVELDSYRFHNSRYSWEQDRRRDREARARGDELRRYTYSDLTENPAEVVREVRALLSRFDNPG